MYYKTNLDSPVGMITLASDDKNLLGVWMDGQKYFAATAPEQIIQQDDHPVLCAGKRWLERYFDGVCPEISELPLAPKGSSFRQEVWKILMSIPYGETITYGDIAQMLAKKRGIQRMSSQAVGGAVGHNPISIIIPCHRVIGANGNLTGYAGGCELKIKLLELEGVDLSGMFIPKKGTAL
ncbi:methylated-DNA-[protein]-cysteine S-methyltransferase [Clostridiales Family XIII bacterium PM5-7]